MSLKQTRGLFHVQSMFTPIILWYIKSMFSGLSSLVHLIDSESNVSDEIQRYQCNKGYQLEVNFMAFFYLGASFCTGYLFCLFSIFKNEIRHGREKPPLIMCTRGHNS